MNKSQIGKFFLTKFNEAIFIMTIKQNILIAFHIPKISLHFSTSTF